MRTIAKYTLIVAASTLLLYCVGSGPGLDGGLRTDAIAQDAGGGDGGVCNTCVCDCEPRCAQCITRTVYTGTLDASGYAELIIPNWDSNDPPSITFYQRLPPLYLTPPSWKKGTDQGILITDDGLAIVGCHRGYDCWPDGDIREYMVVVIK